MEFELPYGPRRSDSAGAAQPPGRPFPIALGRSRSTGNIVLQTVITTLNPSKKKAWSNQYTPRFSVVKKSSIFLFRYAAHAMQPDLPTGVPTALGTQRPCRHPSVSGEGGAASRLPRPPVPGKSHSDLQRRMPSEHCPPTGNARVARPRAGAGRCAHTGPAGAATDRRIRDYGAAHRRSITLGCLRRADRCRTRSRGHRPTPRSGERGAAPREPSCTHVLAHQRMHRRVRPMLPPRCIVNIPCVCAESNKIATRRVISHQHHGMCCASATGNTASVRRRTDIDARRNPRRRVRFGLPASGPRPPNCLRSAKRYHDGKKVLFHSRSTGPHHSIPSRPAGEESCHGQGRFHARGRSAHRRRR